jgi:hypothetical protein
MSLTPPLRASREKDWGGAPNLLFWVVPLLTMPSGCAELELELPVSAETAFCAIPAVAATGSESKREKTKGFVIELSPWAAPLLSSGAARLERHHILRPADGPRLAFASR